MEIAKINGVKDYFISKEGLVYRQLSFKNDRNGYLRARLPFGGKLSDGRNKRKFIPLHRLVALAFIPNPDNKETVNHINGIKTDNDVQNLEWATRREQTEHMWRTGLKKKNNA